MGMLVDVTDGDLPAGSTLAAGVDRLIVVGADWTRTPAEAAVELDELFGAHHETGHLSYLQLGTPTNHTTASEASADQPSEPAIRPRASDPGGAAAEQTEQSAAARLLAATGLSAPALRVAPGADTTEHRWASALIDATWEATAGHFLGELLDPVVDDDHIETLRLHASTYVQPGGPLPLLRIDRQPYGVLPVVAPTFDAINPVLSALHRTLQTIRQVIAPGIAAVPRLGAATDRDDISDTLVELLQRTPVAWALATRTLHDPVIQFITMQDWTARIDLQTRVRNVVLRQLGVTTTPRLDEFALDPRSRPFTLPFVAKGDAGTAYLGELATALRADNAHQQLRLRQSTVTVLEALLAFAGTQEIERAATDALRAHLTELNTGQHTEALAMLAKRGVRTPTLVRVEELAADEQLNQTLAPFASGRDLSNRIVPKLTGTQTIGQSVAKRLSSIIAQGQLHVVGANTRDNRDPHRQLARFTQSLDVLADAPVDELEWAFRGVLDCFATRIDAWVTSLASSRLADHRAEQPEGIYTGCFAWVENLRPDAAQAGAAAAPQTLGYIHSPSIDHATATAILRAGRHASNDETFDLAITSRRVREAERILDGLASDQSLASLLGFRIERVLRDSLTLGRYILPLRGVAPLATTSTAPDTPAETSAGDVVDGLALLELWRRDPDSVFARASVTQADQRRLRDALNEVDAVFDALSDVLVAESIFQISAGNVDRAGAAMRSHDRAERSNRLEFVRTPVSGSALTHRVIVTTTSTGAPAGWPRDLRSRAEPRFDAWLGRILGPADEIVLTADVERPGQPNEQLSTNLAELGLGATSFVLAMQRTGAQQTTEFEQRLVAHFADMVAQPSADDELVIDAVQLEPLRALSSWASELMRAGPLGPEDLLPDDVTGLATYQVAELQRRVDLVRRDLELSHDRIVDLVERVAEGTNPTLRSLATRLDRASMFEPLAAPEAPMSHPDARSILVAQLQPTVQGLAARRSRGDEILATVDGAAEDEAVALLIAAMRALLGPTQPVLPVFRLSDAQHLSGGLARRPELLDGDETAPIAWLHKMALVRPSLDPFAALLMHAEAAIGDITAEIAVTQWPLHATPRWYALANSPDGPPPDGATCIAGHMADADFDSDIAGIVVDTWSEVVPATEAVTGLSLHYDAPGARAPQSIILAVHPSATPDGWDFDLLVDTVNEAVELTHLRGVGPRELGALAGLLPALFVPDAPSRDSASVSIRQMSELFMRAAGTEFGDVLGKD